MDIPPYAHAGASGGGGVGFLNQIIIHSTYSKQIENNKQNECSR